MKRIYIDMDGTLAEWNGNASIEEVASKGYFLRVNPIQSMVDAVKELIENKPKDVEIYILSAVFNDEHSIADKNQWLDWVLPQIPRDNRIFVPYGENKFDAVKTSDDDKYYLIDDFTKNLLGWGGTGIKVLNGINHTNKTWRGYVINALSYPTVIYNSILGIIAA